MNASESTEGFRKKLSEICSRKDFLNNRQNVHTPYKLCGEMIDKLDKSTSLHDKNILTMNLEFVEVLIYDYGVDKSRIWCILDCSQKAVVLEKHERYTGVNVVRGDFLTWKPDMKFDVTLLNPSFNGNVDLEFIKHAVENTKDGGHVMAVHPAISTVTRKPTKKFADHKKFLNGYVKSLKIFNGNSTFGIRLFYPCQIIHITPGVNHNSFPVEYSFEKNSHTDTARSMMDITKWGNVSEYFSLEQKISRFCSTNQNVDSIVGGADGKYKSRKVKGNFYVNLSGIRGSDFTDSGFNDDFYTSVPRDAIVETKPSKQMWASFDTYQEADNFLKYCKSDFFRFALSILKISSNNHRGELSMVPYFQTYLRDWTKEQITKEIGVTEKEWEFIERVIPKYY